MTLEERDEAILKLRGEGFSASAIAEKLGLPSRSAVLGRIHRLKAGGVSVAAPERRIERKVQPAETTPAALSASDAKMLKLRADGWQANAIAVALGLANGEAVKSRIKALKSKGVAIPDVGAARPKPPQDLANPLQALVEPMERPAEPGMVTLFELRSCACRWPHGDGAEVLFCGAATGDLARSYCPTHHMLAHTGRATPAELRLGKALRERMAA